MNRFTPEERDCYSEDEISLKYLPHSHGYRYEMSNCLFESAFENILKECKCCPGKSSMHSCKVLYTCKQGIFFTTNSKVCFNEKMYFSKQALNSHKISKHGDTIMYCSLCDFKTKSERSLNIDEVRV